MPILKATGAVVDHACANCGVERHLTSNDWVIPEGSDDSVISTPPCVCGATESFSWHDWTYVDDDRKPNHAHVGAKQQVLIERVALSLGRKKRKVHGKPERSYEQAPTAPTQASVRAYAAKLREKKR